MGVAVVGLVAATALAVDQNNNGVSDLYEQKYSLDTSLLDYDLDGDGLTCRQEAAFGTDPRDGASRPVTSLSVVAGVPTFRWKSVSGVRYQVESSSNLSTWSAVGEPQTGTGAELSVAAPSGSRVFLRLSALPSVDSDGDGMNAFEEALLGGSDASLDSDGDGLSDAAESLLGTNPGLADSDGDGIGDAAEIAEGGDPLSAHDGLPPDAELRPLVLRMTYYAGWPNYTTSDPPPIPAIDFTIRDVLSDSIVGNVNQAAAITIGATPGGFFSGYTSRGGCADPSIARGREYELKMNYARIPALWKTGSIGRVFTNTTLSPAGKFNILVYSTRLSASGGYWISNTTGGVWSESTWQSTGTPINNVANSGQFYVHDTLCPTARMWTVDFNLHIDSDNNNDLGELPDCTIAEDDVEETNAKFITRNSNDDDADGVVDSQDLDNKDESDMVPIVFDLGPDSLPYDKITVKFRYNGATAYSPTQSGDLRLWHVNNCKGVRTASDYLQPETAYSATALGFGTNHARTKLYVEALVDILEPRPIEVVFLLNGVEYFTDKVLVWGGGNASILGDVNHDGILMPFTVDQSDHSSETRPLTIRVNDDGTTPDYSDSIVNGAADINDFVPVSLDLEQILTILPPSSSVKYKLKQAESALNFVYTNLTRDTAFSYRDNPTMTGFGPDFSQPIQEASVQQISSAGVELSSAFLTNLSTLHRGVLLLEARSAPTQPLVVSIEKDGTTVAEVALHLMCFDMLSDINNDGKQDGADAACRNRYYAFDATDLEKAAAREYLFVNDAMSNGLSDVDDPKRVIGITEDDDVQELKVSATATSGTVWFDHPALASLEFYSAKTCTPAQKLVFPWALSATHRLPEKVYVRAQSAITSQIEGDLVFKFGSANRSATIAEARIPLTVVKEIGNAAYFAAADDYILENNTRFYVSQKNYGGEMMRNVVMRQATTKLTALDTRYRGTPRYGIDEVVGANPGQSVVINGNFADDWEISGISLREATRHLGRLISAGVLDAEISTDSAQSSKVLAGPNAYYIAQRPNGEFVFAKGEVPLNAGFSEALGGVNHIFTGDTEAEAVNMYGHATINGDKLLFVISTDMNVSSSGSGNGAVGSHDDAITGSGATEMYVLDGSSSVALAYQNSAGVLQTKYKGSKQTGMPYYIHTYLMFNCTKAR